MPNISTMMPSKYLKKADCAEPTAVTIRSFKHENVAPQGQAEEKKWVMYFDEFENGLVMNSTNLQLAAQALGSENTDDWTGKRVVIYDDPNVSFGGKLTGGIRIRKAESNKPGRPPGETAKAFAQRMQVAISSNVAEMAADELSRKPEAFINEVWANLGTEDQDALTSVWPG